MTTTTTKLVLLFAAGLSSISDALDLEFHSITCDDSLPAYVLQDNLRISCDGGANTRCTFGSTVQISGTMQYQGLYKHFLSEYSENGYDWSQGQSSSSQQQQQVQQQYSNMYQEGYNQYYQQEYAQQYDGQEEAQEEKEVEAAEGEQVQEGEEEDAAQQDQQQSSGSSSSSSSGSGYSQGTSSGSSSSSSSSSSQGTSSSSSSSWNSWNTTGYASADLKLLSIEYNLFNYLPFNFCGDWVRAGQYNNNPCPYDGTYTFSIPYTLPWDDGDITTWFATGWQGVSDLIIYKEATEEGSPDLLASCQMHWKTYVTQADEADGWKTLPSAAQTGIILAAIAAFMCCCCMYLSCCRRRKRKRHITDADYAPDLEDTTETSKAEFTLFDDSKSRAAKKKAAKDDMIHKINLTLKEPDWV